jgi:hypothetical protein
VDTILLFLGIALLTISFVITDFSHLLKLLGFREEALVVLQDAMAISVLAFALLTAAQPEVVFKPPGLLVTAED